MTTKILILSMSFVVILTIGAYIFIDRPIARAEILYNPSIIPTAGIASYYSYECADKPMANGKLFNPEKRTCASWFYNFGTVLIVKSLDTGRSTEVVVTDRGPNKRLVKEGRVIDLSKRAFQDICNLKKGLTKVTISIKKIRT